MKSSERATSLVTQSASFWGMPPDSRAPLRLMSSRALRAASRAWAARMAFMQICLDSVGCSSSQEPRCFDTAWLTNFSISGLSSFSLVWLLNCGSGSRTESTLVSPSRRSSPEGVRPLSRLRFFA